jgi:mRNA interferase MazF
MYEQKEIVLMPFPYSDLTGSKQRPALIVSNNLINKTQDRICCLITSQQPEDGIAIDSLETGTLPFKSWVKPQRLFTIHEKAIRKTLCRVTDKFHDKVILAVNSYLKRRQR